jgi:ribosomal protein L16/L10AE
MNDLKYRKKQKKSIKGTKFYKTALTYGTYGLYILENGQLTLNQLEAIRKKLSIVFKNSKY